MDRRVHRFIDQAHSDDYVEWIGWPLPNVWLGVSCENQEQADARIPALLQTPAAVRFVSCEPMLGPVDLSAIHARGMYCANALSGDGFDGCALNLVIAGVESGPGRRRCGLEPIQSLVDQCATAGVAAFVKQIEVNGRVSHDPQEWPEHLRIRQMPEARG